MLLRDDILLGKLLVNAEYVTQEQIEECVQSQQEGGEERPIGQLLVEKGYLTDTELADLLDIQQEYMRQLSDQLAGTGTRPPGTVKAVKPTPARAETADEVTIPDIKGYKILRVLGRGTMGIVYRAKQLSMDRDVAIKVLSPRFAQNQSFVARFKMEARASARLNHPHIVQGMDVGEENGQHYFIMEYVDGRRVGDILRRGGAMDERRSTQMVLQISRALEHAHRFGIVHRDIKPDNIILTHDVTLTHDHTAKLCDLGLVRWSKEDSKVFQHEGRVGTPHYMSPEQVNSDDEIDTRSDIYSLGATFYHMVVGQVPFDGATVEEVLRAHCEAPLVPPGVRNPGISQKVEYVVIKMLARRKEDRYQTPKELVMDLGLVLNGMAPKGMAEAAKAPPPRLPSRPTPRISRTATRWQKARPLRRPRSGGTPERGSPREKG
ncbi:MAG: protein kinase [Planctomycetes bacterium]|nr:protein kinase [Planctomycetota bacterium]